ncbi:MAG: molybdenum ABC transporter ATP-binding protein [Vicinamibacterales bacterium]
MSRLSVDCRVRLSPAFELAIAVQIEAGVTIVFGPSGSGKSTLLRCVSGLTKPDAGVVRIGTRTLFDAERHINVPVEQRRVGYVFQQLALFPHMTVAQNLRYGLAHVSAAEARDRIDRIVASFRIAHLLDRRPGAISGGERQRTALARSLVTDPDVLLLDEPLSALDHRTQSLIMDDLRQWNAARQIPILYVTHAHREAFALGTRALVVDGGRLIASGTPQEVLEAPASEPLAQLAGFENFFDSVVRAIAADAATMTCGVEGTALTLEVPRLVDAEPGDHVRLAIRAGDVLVATLKPSGLSARNVVPGTVRAVRRVGPTVAVDVDAGAPFEAHVTPHACDALDLRPGTAVWLVMKTHSCHPVSMRRTTFDTP